MYILNGVPPNVVKTRVCEPTCKDLEGEGGGGAGIQYMQGKVCNSGWVVQALLYINFCSESTGLDHGCQRQVKFLI